MVGYVFCVFVSFLDVHRKIIQVMKIFFLAKKNLPAAASRNP